jgi:hypothetical protein
MSVNELQSGENDVVCEGEPSLWRSKLFKVMVRPQDVLAVAKGLLTMSAT